MIYREDSIKNLLNNSIIRYDDPAALEVRNHSVDLLPILTHTFSLYLIGRKSTNGFDRALPVLLHLQGWTRHTEAQTVAKWGGRGQVSAIAEECAVHSVCPGCTH